MKLTLFLKRAPMSIAIGSCFFSGAQVSQKRGAEPLNKQAYLPQSHHSGSTAVGL